MAGCNVFSFPLCFWNSRAPVSAGAVFHWALPWLWQEGENSCDGSDGLDVLGALPWPCSMWLLSAGCPLLAPRECETPHFSATHHSEPAVPLRHQGAPCTGSSKHCWGDFGQLCAPSSQILMRIWPLCRVFPQSSKQPAPITGAGQTSGMDSTALDGWHLDYGLEVGLAGLDLQLDFDLGGLSNPNSMMVMMIIVMIVEKNNLFLKREIHDGFLGVGEEADVVGVVLIELSLNFESFL